MDGRDHIIRLGKCLAAEAKAGYADAVKGGLEAFAAGWAAEANGAANEPAVRATLERLRGYGELDVAERRARVDRSLAELRELFKSRLDAAREGSGARVKLPSPATASAQPPAVYGAAQAASKDRPSKPAPPAVPLALDSPLTDVPGIGPKQARNYARLGIDTVEDALYYYPFRYEDFSRRITIAELVLGEMATVIGQVEEIRSFQARSGLGSVNVTLRDETGTLSITFWGQRWLTQQLRRGDTIVVSGKVGEYNGRPQLKSPSWEPLRESGQVHTDGLVPVYPLAGGMYQKSVRETVKRAAHLAAPLVEEYVPQEVRERAHLLPLREALARIHYPGDAKHLALARYRLGFDEFLFIQLGVLQRKQLWQGVPGFALPFNAGVHAELQERLPFRLTGAQERALGEIFADLGRPVPMARLLQGDVGSGKTVVAAAALLQAIANGYQGAIMAPTEILAEQHYRGLKQVLSQVRVPRDEVDRARHGDRWKQRLEPEQLKKMAELKRLLGMTDEEDMGGLGVRVALLTGSLRTKERKRVLESIAQGDVDLVIGTHALIQDAVQYRSLGMVVIDEQHRFGVEQRERLKSKGHHPHLLVMTATPIPRTLALSIYGDLDVSILDELPPGRQPIKTKWITKAEVERAYKHIRKEVDAGRQAFVICPLVEESEKLELDSAVETREDLQYQVFPELRVGLVHGRMTQLEKDSVMSGFRGREFDILVATSVVEVGIDVPNATTILILGAERFGLAQLHQFRGRVGRGEHQSYCIVVSDIENEVTEQRLRALEESNDGFKLAEVDLELRGPGEFFGRRQSGTPDLKMARLGDTRLLHAARAEAERILQGDRNLERPEHALLKRKTDAFWVRAAASS